MMNVGSLQVKMKRLHAWTENRGAMTHLVRFGIETNVNTSASAVEATV